MKHDAVKAQFDIIFQCLRTLGFKRKRANAVTTKLVNEYFDNNYEALVEAD